MLPIPPPHAIGDHQGTAGSQVRPEGETNSKKIGYQKRERKSEAVEMTV
jgi:hypothetical protein